MYGSTRLVFQKKIGTAGCVVGYMNAIHYEYSIFSAVFELKYHAGKV